MTYYKPRRPDDNGDAQMALVIACIAVAISGLAIIISLVQEPLNG